MDVVGWRCREHIAQTRRTQGKGFLDFPCPLAPCSLAPVFTLAPNPQPLLLLQQLQHALWHLVGLGQHRGTGLLQDLGTGQCRSLGGEIRIQNTRA